MIVVIPAYEPDDKLIKLVSSIINKFKCRILIIDDGSGKKYKDIFDKASALGAELLRHETNKGKGAALKTAFSELRKHNCNDVIITADCDGQHLPDDILKVYKCAINNKDKLILGTRHFSGKVPLRSSFGNKITSTVFEVVNGEKVSDTQTGLRGFSSSMLEWLCIIEGDRYEYEMNMLLEADIHGYEIKEVPIETIYIEGNKSSHFNPLIDSLKIYFPILKFSMSSSICGILDFILLFLFRMITHNLLAAVVSALFFSASINYIMNKIYVFNKNKAANTISLPRYIFLAVLVLILNYIILDYLCILGLNLFFAKLLTEAILFIFSFVVQKKFVFI